VDYLVLYMRGWSKYHYGNFYGKTEKVYVEDMDFPHQEPDEVYKCPKCGEIVFTNTIDAHQFVTRERKKFGYISLSKAIENG